MSNRTRVFELLEEALDSGRTPEEVCAADPALLGEVQERWRRCRALGAEIDALFPESDDGRRRRVVAEDFPRIPGYEVTALLGRGGMGVVYRARHLKLDRPVAIKMTLSGGYASGPELARFAQEARTVAALRHPHVVQVYDVGDLDGRPYYTMEFVEGKTLAERLRGAPLPARPAAELVALIAGAVESAHRAGVVHRDLKPANVLLTADGTPKVADFGLARRLDGDAGLTLTGTRLGTPSYMAPEQATGKAGAAGPASDVYSLGAILYETLTGRPPFRGETAAETERQLLTEEPARPSLLNSRVPRDLETVCLKCLQKAPLRRYGTAAELAGDLERFLKGEPIFARRVGRVERTLKWVKRHPGTATVVASGLAAALAIVVGATWIVSERAALRLAVEADLGDAISAQAESSWEEAEAAMDRAEFKLGDRGPSDLRARLGQARRDQALVGTLKGAYSATAMGQSGRADRDYAQAFRDAGLGGPDEKPETVAKRVTDSHIRATLVAALDEWAAFPGPHREWLLDVARRADDDPTGWRRRVRAPEIWRDDDALAKMAESAPVDEHPAAFLLTVARQLNALNRDYVPLLIRAQEAHPRDYWVSYKLGLVMAGQKKWEDSVRFFHAAEAISPESATIQNNLGIALINAGRLDEGIARLRKCARVEPLSGGAQRSLAFALVNAGRHREAVPELELAILGNPNDAWNHNYLARSLAAVERYDEAIDSYRRAITLESGRTGAKRELRNLLIARGRHEEALAVWREHVDDASSTVEDWDGYAECCAFLGREDEYRRVCGALLGRFGKDADPRVCERTGRACLLMPGPDDEVARAAAMVDLALAGESTLPASYHRYFMFAKGLAEYRAGRFESALSIVEHDAAGALGPAPLLVAAMARHRLGEEPAARRTLAGAALSFDWSAAQAKNADAWIYHTLRREAERLILPKFTELVEGISTPQDIDERVILLAECRFTGRLGRCAELWAETVASPPGPTIDLFDDAAKALALAASGSGEDAARYEKADRAEWRRAAVRCLTDYLDDMEKRLESTSTISAAVQNTLTDWQRAPELAGVRVPEAVSRLSAQEQRECAALWARVDSIIERMTRPSQ